MIQTTTYWVTGSPQRVLVTRDACRPLPCTAIFTFHIRHHFLDACRLVRRRLGRCVSRWRPIKLESSSRSAIRNNARPAEIETNASAGAALVHAAGIRFSSP